MNICQLIQEAPKGEYKIVHTSAPKWRGVVVSVNEPICFNMEYVRSVRVVSAPDNSPALQFVNKPVPLLGAIVSAVFEPL